MNGFLHARIILRLITFHATLELITFLLGKLIGRDRFRQPYSRQSRSLLGALPCNYLLRWSHQHFTYWTIRLHQSDLKKSSNEFALKAQKRQKKKDAKEKRRERKLIGRDRFRQPYSQQSRSLGSALPCNYLLRWSHQHFTYWTIRLHQSDLKKKSEWIRIEGAKTAKEKRCKRKKTWKKINWQGPLPPTL